MRKIPLGSTVRYWRRAASNRRWLGNERHGSSDISNREHSRIRRLQNEGRVNYDQSFYVGGAPDRHVLFWEEEGEGVVVGLTHRKEGRFGNQFGQNFLAEIRSVPLYLVKTRLGQAKPHLIPVDSIEWIDNHATFGRPVADSPAPVEVVAGDFELLVDVPDRYIPPPVANGPIFTAPNQLNNFVTQLTASNITYDATTTAGGVIYGTL